MTDLNEQKIRDLLTMGEGERLDALKAMLPKPTYPEHMMGRWAKHPEYGDVLVTIDQPDSEGEVLVTYGNKGHGAPYAWVPVSSLKFPYQATRPEDVPVGEAWLVDCNCGTCTKKRIPALKGAYGWHYTYGTDLDEFMFAYNKNITLIAPLTPGLPAAPEPEFVETAEEYEALSEGSVIVERNGKTQPAMKHQDGSWHFGPYDAGVDNFGIMSYSPSRVLRRGWGDE